jgi:hypothetical protein
MIYLYIPMIYKIELKYLKLSLKEVTNVAADEVISEIYTNILFNSIIWYSSQFKIKKRPIILYPHKAIMFFHIFLITILVCF